MENLLELQTNIYFFIAIRFTEKDHYLIWSDAFVNLSQEIKDNFFCHINDWKNQHTKKKNPNKGIFSRLPALTHPAQICLKNALKHTQQKNVMLLRQSTNSTFDRERERKKSKISQKGMRFIDIRFYCPGPDFFFYVRRMYEPFISF